MGLRLAVRALRRDPTLALVMTLTLVICIGANTTVFSLVNSIVIRPLPYPAADRIYWLSERMGREQMEVGIGADYYSLREQSRVFEDVAAYDTTTVNWAGVDKPEQLDAAQVTASFFHVLGTQPMLGRYLARGEEGKKAPKVVVLNYAFWRSRLGGDRDVVGKTLTLDRSSHVVIGVMPQGFDYPRGTQLWKPIEMDEASERPRLVTNPMWMVSLLARAKAGVTERQIEAELSRLSHTIRAEYPKEFEAAGFLDGMTILATPLQKRITGDLRPALLVLSGAVALVLLIACANLANILLARAGARQREIAVRLALGSDRVRIARQVLTESLIFSVPGGVGGAVVAYAAVTALNAWKPFVLERYTAISMDATTLAFSLGLTLLTGLVFGMAPALTAAGVNVHGVLKAGSLTQTGGRSAARVRRLLVVAELSVSLVLLIGAGLLARSFLKLAATDLGFPSNDLLTLRVNLEGGEYATGESQARFYDDMLERVRPLPMVRAAAVSTDLPLSGEHPYSGMGFQVMGRTPLPPSQRPQANATVVSRDFFRTVGIPLRSGRTFDAQDTTRSQASIVVNETFARKVFGAENPIGQRITAGPSGRNRWTIVGVVGDIRASQLGAEPEPLVYRCLCQATDRFLTRMRIIVRTAGDPRAAIRAVEAQVHAVNSNQPVFDVKTMDERLAASLAPQRFNLMLIGAFAAIAMVLAALGVYGVMSYLVTRRTREFGIRMALGAGPAHVLRLVAGEGVVLAAIAVAAGLAGAWGLTRHVKSMLYGVTTLDGATFAVMPLVLAAIAMAASLAPARRASRVDPMVALREE
ncbi:MAG: ABC transporter permease [Bryobacteraceae bacterium]